MAKKKTKANIALENKVLKWTWGILLGGIVFFILLMTFIALFTLPNTAELENPKFEQASIIYSADGIELGKYFSKNRTWIRPKNVSKHLVDALIATEDIRFYDHSGIDARSLVRSILSLGRKGGASTISQQLAKQFFTKYSKNFPKRVFQKLQEWIIAVQFEKRYTKEEIISMYLNKFDFRYDSYGIEAASQTYFGKHQENLTIDEAAMLIGMLKNPSRYNPKQHPETALKRREVVLSQMKKANYISQQQYDDLRVKPLDLSNFKRSMHSEGPAPYFRQVLKVWTKKLLKDRKIVKKDGSPYNLDKDGLKIYTTIDSRYQFHAEKAMKKHMKHQQEKYFDRWKNMNPLEYNATKSQIKIRQAKIKKMVESSDRYRRIRYRELGNISSKISDAIPDVRLWDGDIRRMIGEAKSPGHLQKEQKRGQFSKEQKATYEKIMNSDYWPDLIQSWNNLQKAIKKSFNTKVKTKVFAYNDAEEKDAYMTPMDSIMYHIKHLQLGSISIEPQTGYVKSWVGGIGFKRFQYDHVTSRRQVGSTFKPFVYMTALDMAISPCYKIKDEEQCIYKGGVFDVSDDWCPENSNEKIGFSGEEYTMKECLKKSLNSASVYLMKQIGNVQAVKNQASNMGINQDHIPNYPSICLGTAELTALELTGAYTTYANNGVKVQPTFVTKIEDKNGQLLYTSNPISEKAVAENINYVMLDMLQYASSDVTNRPKTVFGGKTGTTDKHTDGWFMGLTPNLVVGTWVGGSQPWVRFRGLGDGAGSHMARPYFLDFMHRLERDSKIGFNTNAVFSRPEGELGIEIDCQKYETYEQNSLENDEDYDEEFDDEDL